MKENEPNRRWILKGLQPERNARGTTIPVWLRNIYKRLLWYQRPKVNAFLYHKLHWKWRWTNVQCNHFFYLIWRIYIYVSFKYPVRGKSCLVSPRVAVPSWAPEIVLSPCLAADEGMVLHVLSHLVWWKKINRIWHWQTSNGWRAVKDKKPTNQYNSRSRRYAWQSNFYGEVCL